MAKGRETVGTAEELEARIAAYFAALEANPKRRGGPSDLLAAVGLDMETARRLAAAETGRYREHGRLLREAATRLRGHLETAPAWADSSTKALFLIRQALWDGQAYGDGEKARDAEKAEMRVVFGEGEEAFG